jgi:protein-S-isoprenylcysteine O-methyltransferase Ste14
MRQKHFIDSHKAATGLFVLLLMAIYDQWDNPTAWIYLALHGTYGILWVLKSRFFPDKSWERPATWQLAAVTWGGLTLYWVAPWILTSRGVEAPLWYLAMCICLYTLGVFLHFAADMQKQMWLKLRPGELLNQGLWARVRNPNYFGELLIYLGFGLLAMHWLPILLLAAFVLAYWIPNMLRKDASLARYPEFPSYKAHSRLFIPLVF